MDDLAKMTASELEQAIAAEMDRADRERLAQQARQNLKALEKMAQKLRDEGWTVIPPLD